MKASDLAWGLRDAAIEAPALWGARAIFTERVVDFLWDRQDLRADDPAAKTLLMAHLNGTRGNGGNGRGAIAKFKRLVDRGAVEIPEGREPAVIALDGVRFYASELDSSGYLYVTAHLIEKEA